MSCSCSPSTIDKVKGENYSRSFEFKTKTGAVIDLTGSVIKFIVKKGSSDTTPLIDITLSIPNPTNGKALLDTTLDLDTGSYHYAFTWTDSLGRMRPLESGKLTITSL